MNIRSMVFYNLAIKEKHTQLCWLEMFLAVTSVKHGSGDHRTTDPQCRIINNSLFLQNCKLSVVFKIATQDGLFVNWSLKNF